MDEKKVKDEEDAELFRTLIRKDVKDRLKAYAVGLATGFGKWDYGVAIERLLDNADFEARIKVLECRIDDLEAKSVGESVKKDNGKADAEEPQLLGKWHLKKKDEGEKSG